MQEDDKEASESQPEPEGQPPPATPIPLPPTQRQKRWQYLLGLALGLIPLIVFLVGYGVALGTTGGALNAIGASLIGVILYIVELIVTIVFIARKDVLFAGYGLLTAFLATPIVVVIGCSVLPNLIHPS